jgi:type II secretory pathway component PulC
MSLINDALKKVSEADRGKAQAVATPQPDFETRAMQPVVYEDRPMHLLWISIALFMAAIGVAGYLFAKAASESKATKPAAAPVSNRPDSVANTDSKISQIISTIPAPQAVSETKSTAVSPATSAQAASVTPTQPAPVVATASSGPTFRLKGILYTKNPTAMINDNSIQVGGEVDGAVVKKIEQTSVTIEFEGKTTVLKPGLK